MASTRFISAALGALASARARPRPHEHDGGEARYGERLVPDDRDSNSSQTSSAWITPRT
jgi:hypothetical protein